VTEFYHNLKIDLTLAGRYLNKENLAALAQRSRGWKEVQQDVALIEKQLGVTLGPKSNSDFIHRNITSTAFYRWKTNKPIEREIIESGKIRRSLG